MADFEAAYKRTMRWEGRYAADPADPGGETYCGISRRAHPSWPGWKLVDGRRKASCFPSCLDTDYDLQRLVRGVYQVQYWQRIRGNEIPVQAVADEVFDSAVHQGVARAVEQLQRALNVLNRRGRKWADIQVDGDCGPVTSSALRACLVEHPTSRLVTAIRGLRIARMIDLMEHNEALERFAPGWLDRVSVA